MSVWLFYAWAAGASAGLSVANESRDGQLTPWRIAAHVLLSALWPVLLALFVIGFGREEDAQ